MLNKIIDEILAAETEAEETLRAAEAEAKAIKLKTDAALEERRELFYENQRAARKEAYAAAEQKAETAYDAAIKNAERDAAELTRNAEKNIKKAVDLILEHLKL